jgi:hypothetical protein
MDERWRENGLGNRLPFSSTTGSLSRTSMWDHSIAQTPMQDTFFAAIAVIARHECLTQILNRDSPLF